MQRFLCSICALQHVNALLASLKSHKTPTASQAWVNSWKLHKMVHALLPSTHASPSSKRQNKEETVLPGRAGTRQTLQPFHTPQWGQQQDSLHPPCHSLHPSCNAPRHNMPCTTKEAKPSRRGML